MSNDIFKVVLIAGSTGQVGQVVTESFLKKKKFDIRILVQPNIKEGGDKKQNIIDDFVKKGATKVFASYDDPESLKKALQGVDLVVSTLGGPLNTTQTPLIKAAKEAKVKRFVPSEFGYSLTQMPEYPFVQAKKDARKDLVALGLEHVFVVTGYFYEYTAYAIDWEKGTISQGGDGSQEFYGTALADIGRLVPDIVTNPKAANREVILAGFIGNYEQVAKEAEALSGKKLQRNWVSAAELHKKAASPNIMEAIFALLSLLVAEDRLKGIKPNYSEFTNEKLSTLHDFIKGVVAQKQK